MTEAELYHRVEILTALAVAMIDTLDELGRHPMVGRMIPADTVADLMEIRAALLGVPDAAVS